MEIGSEFWEASDTGKKKYLLSGRTALEYIIRDILEEHHVTSVLMPSYCCHTMIEPFVRHGIKVRFYDVYFNGSKGLCAELPEELDALENQDKSQYKSQDSEIFYYMTYFGLSKLCGLDLEAIRKSYRLVIEDQTHSWLSDGRQGGKDTFADYTYISFRKWTGLYGIAEARKSTGGFIPNIGNSGDAYTDRRKGAMRLKKGFIEKQKSLGNGIGDKQEKEYIQKCKKEFLEELGEAERYIGSDYVGYTPPAESMLQFMSVDWDFIKERRRSNADFLLEGLKDIPGCTLIYKNRRKTDTPLFVPVLIEDNRDGLRKYLIDHDVYCPVHWPLSEYHEGISDKGKEIYSKELSLVCDQRYGRADMERVIRLIKDYFAG